MNPHTWHFVHQLNPVLAEIFGVNLWYYGMAYTIGFLGVYLWFKRSQGRLEWSDREVYDLSILAALGVLVMGRAFEIVVYEWPYYREHLSQVLSYWRGGMASHGVLSGGLLGMWLFTRLRGRGFLELADEMAIPAAFLMGVGRIGNFIDGQIVGSITDAWWSVKFPDAEGFRHPVTLYDSLKNFLMIPLLLLVRRASPPGRGMLLAHFVFWYGFGRIFVDLYREYPAEFFGIGRGQYFNLLMALAGLALMLWFRSATRGQSTRKNSFGASAELESLTPRLWPRRLALLALLIFPLVIPTDWTQGNGKKPEAPSPNREVPGVNMRDLTFPDPMSLFRL
jgi:phosphatidylglycerol:prolipoprotein diacylglycerol transferase